MSARQTSQHPATCRTRVHRCGLGVFALLLAGCSFNVPEARLEPRVEAIVITADPAALRGCTFLGSFAGSGKRDGVGQAASPRTRSLAKLQGDKLGATHLLEYALDVDLDTSFDYTAYRCPPRP
ncbi:MAG: hypothetical protein HY749_00605 [Gammaproteobacteria bacterium]|nr:hypothetical protein [Gammaproteobacteria bacterium]